MKPASRSLESLKKRAKHLVRQHAERYHPVAERIRLGLPDFAGRSDREILDAPFALHQAQELIAREHGLESWAQLKERSDRMSAHTSTTMSSAPRLLHVHPQVFVVDLPRALAFYAEQLGFQVGYTYGEPPFYALVQRDGVGLNLRHVDRAVWDAESRERETDLLSAMIVVEDVKALFVEYKSRDVPLHQRLREQPWGARDFIVRDPDGNLIGFASPGQDGA